MSCVREGACRIQRRQDEQGGGKSGVGGGELRLRSTRGKAFGCCSKPLTPQRAGRERRKKESERERGRQDGGVGGLKRKQTAEDR